VSTRQLIHLLSDILDLGLKSCRKGHATEDAVPNLLLCTRICLKLGKGVVYTNKDD
jgi:hypothetical protein